MPSLARRLTPLLLLCVSSLRLCAQSATVPDLAARLPGIANQALASAGVPSASIAIVKDGQSTIDAAYGMARLQPPTPATPEMRYSVGSISKQFTAAAVLMLEQEGKLTLNDPVAKFLPGLTRANEVTLRMLLSHTSGYEDYWPQDYVMPPMLEATTAQRILDAWAKKPLDFDPGAKWQYSNTNYVIAGRIVEQVSGEPIFRFLQERIFVPLKMTSVYNSDLARLGDTDAEGYLRYALGPPRPAPKEGPGWLFAAGELAMTASDLAKWNISMMNQSLLSPESYKEMFTPVKLNDGTDTHYGLGVFIRQIASHAALEHDGEVSGFVSKNIVFPAERAAITVLTNEDASSAADDIAREIAPLLLGAPTPTPAADAALAQAKAIFAGLQEGKLDRSLFTSNCNAYFSPQAVSDFAASLKPLGPPASFTQASESLRGGMTFYVFVVTFGDSGKKVVVTTYTMPGGKVEQYMVGPLK